jgi:hypothetical protein
MNKEELRKAVEVKYEIAESATVTAGVRLAAYDAARDATRIARDAWFEADTAHDDAWRDYDRVQRLLKKEERT